jgi:GTP cyclohydrolase I
MHKEIQAIKTLLEYIGEDPNREGLLDTPERFLKAWKKEFFCGYQTNPNTLLQTTFEEVEQYDSIILLKDIDFNSYCEHHIVPITGKAHIAYIPNKKVVGISKLARVLHAYAKRLQIQERLTEQTANTIYQTLNPIGVVVIVEAKHFCMHTRGVKTNSNMITISKKGNIDTQEVLSLVRH